MGSAGRLPVPDSRDEIHRLAVTLNGMLARLEAGRSRQRAFVADAAHELRSPLANMRTELEVAQRLAGDTDWPHLAADLLTDVERLSRLVDDLLLLARADEEPPPPRHLAEVDLGELARQVAGARTTARVPVTAVLDGADDVGVTGDADALRRVVDNLVDNAVRHARSEVRVEVGVEPGLDPLDGAAAGRALIAVVDDGPGIPAGDAQRVFERFTRLDDARSRDAGGAGLGLAIVAELVRRHGGAVCLRDASPGLRAEVLLPRGRDPL
jgi:signal transduction histidine kinase